MSNNQQELKSTLLLVGCLFCVVLLGGLILLTLASLAIPLRTKYLLDNYIWACSIASIPTLFFAFISVGLSEDKKR